MKTSRFAFKVWGREFLRVLVISFGVFIFSIFTGIIENRLSFLNILLFYILAALGGAFFIIIGNIKRFQFIFFIRPKYHEFLDSHQIEPAEIKKYRAEQIRLALIGFFSFGITLILMLWWLGNNNSFIYLLNVGLLGGTFMAFFSYPEKYRIFLHKVCIVHLEAEEKEYMESFKNTWIDNLPLLIVVIGINLYAFL